MKKVTGLAIDQQVICCVCGQSLKYSKAVEISFALTKNIEEVQTVYAHKDCFQKVLHTSVPNLLK